MVGKPQVIVIQISYKAASGSAESFVIGSGLIAHLLGQVHELDARIPKGTNDFFGIIRARIADDPEEWTAQSRLKAATAIAVRLSRRRRTGRRFHLLS